MTSSLTDSLQLTLVAMGIVFATLYALSLMMSVFPKLLGHEKPKEPKPAAIAAPVVEQPIVEPDTNSMSAQTIAVIASAIAAYLGRAPEDLSVIAIRRTGSNLSPWTLNVRRESVQNQ